MDRSGSRVHAGGGPAHRPAHDRGPPAL